MSLRDALKKIVAGCAPYQTQHATIQESSATGAATNAQQTPANPHGIRDCTATGAATATQQGQKGTATYATSNEKLRVAFASARNTQLGALTGHRVIADLIQAAMKVCDQHGDGEAAREEMRTQCLELPPHLQADLLAHFLGKPAKQNTDAI